MDGKRASEAGTFQPSIDVFEKKHPGEKKVSSAEKSFLLTAELMKIKILLMSERSEKRFRINSR